MPSCPGQSLNEYIDKTTLECLNQDQHHPVENAFRSDDEELVSDIETDPQLLVKVQFKQAIKLSAIRILGNVEDGSAPRSVKVFQNQPDIGFQEAEDGVALETFNLTEPQLNEGKDIAVRFVKFQNVNCIELFITDNYGAEVTKIKQIQFLGVPTQSTNMADWKPVKG